MNKDEEIKKIKKRWIENGIMLDGSKHCGQC